MGFNYERPNRISQQKLKNNQVMQNFSKFLVVCVLAGAIIDSQAQTVTVDPSTLTLGFMNWSPMPGDAAGYGGYGNSPWGLSDLQASFSGTTLTLNPNINTYAPGVNYWVNADGSGANDMDANIYNETTGVYVDTTLTFKFDVLSDTFASPYSSVGFIKDFSPNYSSFTEQTVALTPGIDSVSLLTSANAGDHIQYGFETDGPDTNPSSLAALESAVITPASAPDAGSTAGLFGLALGLLGLIRARK